MIRLNFHDQACLMTIRLNYESLFFFWIHKHYNLPLVLIIFNIQCKPFIFVTSGFGLCFIFRIHKLYIVLNVIRYWCPISCDYQLLAEATKHIIGSVQFVKNVCWTWTQKIWRIMQLVVKVNNGKWAQALEPVRNMVINVFIILWIKIRWNG